MDAATYLQRAVQAIVVLLAIALGIYISPWLGSSSFILALLCWIVVIIGIFYAAERMPWTDRFDSISKVLRAFAPPLSAEEKRAATQRAELRKQSLWNKLKIQKERIAEEQKKRRFLGNGPDYNFNNPPHKQPDEDTNSTESSEPTGPLLKLEDLTGLASVKKSVRDYENLLKVSKAQGEELPLQLNFVMLGNPGTGKTTVAQIMAQIFYDLGCLPTTKLVLARRDTLIAEYTGQTGPKTRKVFESALGGTLFIDEAYTLAVRPKGMAYADAYAKEAVDTLNALMDQHRGKLAVIVAGYEGQMDDFLNGNPGLPGRFTNYISFPDYTPEECVEIFNKMVAKTKLRLTAEAAAMLPDIFSKLRAGAGDDWANARDVRTLFEEWTRRAQANRVTETNDKDIYSITDQDLQSALAAFLENKKRGSAKKALVPRLFNN
jgi:stage V sporulation protein K